MHHSNNVDVYLYNTSDPIIENSSNIRFAPFPAPYIPGASRMHAGKVVVVVKFFLIVHRLTA